MANLSNTVVCSGASEARSITRRRDSVIDPPWQPRLLLVDTHSFTPGFAKALLLAGVFALANAACGSDSNLQSGTGGQTSDAHAAGSGGATGSSGGGAGQNLATGGTGGPATSGGTGGMGAGGAGSGGSAMTGRDAGLDGSPRDRHDTGGTAGTNPDSGSSPSGGAIGGKDAAAGGGGSGGSGSGGAGGGGSSASLPSGVTAMFPVPGATGICPDPPLRITFSDVPTLGSTGKIQIFGSSGGAVASIDMAASTVTDTIGGTSFVLLRPVYVDGNAVVIYPKTKALGYGQTYYVTVDAGAIKPAGGGSFSVTGATAWRFSTTAAAPTSLSALTVALDGSGAFCTVQGATDALPANNTAATVITIKNGTYHEVVHVSKKSNITLRGEDRAKTQIIGTNNNTQQGSSAGTNNRSLLGFDDTNGLVIENMTIKNLTPQNGSQAEALRIRGCDKCIIRDADIWSLQDTLLWEGRVYAENCLIVGNVDYVWGRGIAYFSKCELRTVGRTGVIVQSRNGVGAYGYVFVDCKLTADSAAKNNMLARIDVSAYPGSHVAYINCQMTNIGSAGWTITGGTATSSLRFWEYQSTDASGTPLSTSGRASGSTQISDAQATSMRDVSVVMGGWQP
jgi:pectin methylesterase-like acyl-CoA thioesterase